MNTNVDIDLLNLRTGLDALYKSVEGIATREPPQPKIPLRSLSGDHITGGKITQFESVGIKDSSTRLSLIITDKGITTKTIVAESFLGDTTFKGNLNVEGEITAKKLHVSEITSDIRIERTTPLEFVSESGDIYNKGILWKGQGNTKQFVYRGNPDRIWSSEILDLHSNAYYSIDGVPVLTAKELGSTISSSNLTKVGTLKNLKTQGNLTVDEYVFYESASQRIGIGTDSPNGMLSIAGNEGEFLIDCNSNAIKIGNWTTTDLNIVTDDTTRIQISATGNITLGSNSDTKTQIVGKLGVNVKNPDVDISTAGPVRFQGKKQEVGDKFPTEGSYRVGDIVWNTRPRPTSYVGWICTREGTPGEWKPFGQIGN